MISATGKRRGFTFIEIFFVIIIIGILVGISAPRLKKALDNALLNNTALTLQSFMNYLSQRAVVEGKIIYLYLDNDAKVYWGQLQDEQTKFKAYKIPASIEIESKVPQVAFYPDGQIDKVTLKLTSKDNHYIELTTQGTYARIKMLQPK